MEKISKWRKADVNLVDVKKIGRKPRRRKSGSKKTILLLPRRSACSSPEKACPRSQKQRGDLFYALSILILKLCLYLVNTMAKLDLIGKIQSCHRHCSIIKSTLLRHFPMAVVDISSH